MNNRKFADIYEEFSSNARKLYLLLMLLTIFSVVIGAYAYAYGPAPYVFGFFFLLTAVLAVLVFIFTSKHYDFSWLAISNEDLINKYEQNNLRFLSINDHAIAGKDLARELFNRSNKYIYIYTGAFNEKFYEPLTSVLKQKHKLGLDVRIAVQEDVNDAGIIPNGIPLKERHPISNLDKHFIVTDYGFRLESDDIQDDSSTKAIFALNLAKANNVELEIKKTFEKLQSEFVEAW